MDGAERLAVKSRSRNGDGTSDDGSDSSVGAPTDAATSWAYRPYLDGLRAVAVYLVLAFHAGILRARGGFIGVDVFFVLSGYLVTRLLVRDLSSSSRIDFRRFYSRRVRRLLPAAAVNLVVVAVIFGAIAAPVEFAEARSSIRAAALYVSNWYFIRQSADYFAADVTSSPVLNYWSLSVEEQFYVVWPLLVFALYRVTRWAGRRHLDLIRIAVVVAGVASLAAALYLARTNVNRAYYGTDTRAYQLLAGAFLALTPSVFVAARRLPHARRVMPWLSVGLIGVIVFLASSALDVGPITRGAMVTGVVFVLIVSLEAASGGIGRGVLSVSPLAYLGRISYGTYLWHWIVILVATRVLKMTPLSTFLVTIPIATGLAALSYDLLEQPIRTATWLGRHRVAVIATGLTVSLLVGVVITPRVLTDAGPKSATAATVATVTGGTPNTADWRSAFFDTVGGKNDTCNPSKLDECSVVHGSGLKVLVAGDSHAEMLVGMITELANRHDLDLSVAPLPFCPWTRGIQYTGVGNNCFTDQASLFDKVVPAIGPDIVVLVHRPIDDLLNSIDVTDQDEGPLKGDPDRQTAALRERITAVVHELRAEGRKVVLVEPIPASRKEDNPETCLSKAEFLEQCRYVTSLDPTPEELIYRELAAADPDVISVDLDRAVCPYLPICDPVVNGQVVKHDDNHLTGSFGLQLLDPFERDLLDHGFLSG